MKSPLSSTVEAALRAAMTADGADPPSATAVAGLYDVLARHLEPLIGAAGVRAIYGRSVHMAALEVPWIAAAADVPDDARPVDALRGCLQQHDARAATEGGRVLLVAFVDLLARLIGEGLTTRLLAQAWPNAFPGIGRQRTER